MKSRLVRVAVGNHVREIRREMDLTQDDVCRRAGISRHTLVRLERHSERFTPTYETMHAVAGALGRSVESLFYPTAPATVNGDVPVIVLQLPAELRTKRQAPTEEVCGADNERLVALGYRFDVCDREPGHPGFHHFTAL